MNYFKLYYNLLNKALLEKRVKSPEIYYEAHHAKPECKGGKFLVLLTGREHFIAHLISTKIYKNDYQLSSAFNKMFSKSNNQDRNLPKSYWYEYKRKLFSKNHPMKNPEILKKHKKAMYEDNLRKSIGKYCDFTNCLICQNITYKNTKCCSKECAKLYRKKTSRRPNAKELKLLNEGKDCVICGKKHLKKYCCSKDCFAIYIKQEDNEYSKNLSRIRSQYIKDNPEKIKESAQKNADNRDNKAIGEKISKTKKENNSGNNCAKSNEIHIYDTNELKYISKQNTSFKIFCQENNLPHSKFVGSYRNSTKINDNYYNNWFAIKIQYTKGNK